MTDPPASATVWFDLDGTLLEHTTDRSLIELAGADCDLTLTDETVVAYRDFLFQYLARGRDRPYERAAALWQRHCDLALDPATFVDRLADRHATDTAVVDGAVDVLDSIGETYSLGLITNGTGRIQRGKLTAHELTDHFESIVVSGETPYMKPDDGIFELAADRVPADQHVYIADRLAYDIVPARENGFRGVWVADEPASPVADATVATVADLTVEQLHALLAD
ncbi:MAG: HAD family hydrolase [Halobacteriales archaeon]|nr:HAD family hydrolase [Halobacteriales archaeon]